MAHRSCRIVHATKRKKKKRRSQARMSLVGSAAAVVAAAAAVATAAASCGTRLRRLAAARLRLCCCRSLLLQPAGAPPAHDGQHVHGTRGDRCAPLLLACVPRPHLSPARADHRFQDIGILPSHTVTRTGRGAPRFPCPSFTTYCNKPSPPSRT